MLDRQFEAAARAFGSSGKLYSPSWRFVVGSVNAQCHERHGETVRPRRFCCAPTGSRDTGAERREINVVLHREELARSMYADAIDVTGNATTVPIGRTRSHGPREEPLAVVPQLHTRSSSVREKRTDNEERSRCCRIGSMSAPPAAFASGGSHRGRRASRTLPNYSPPVHHRYASFPSDWCKTGRVNDT